MLAQWQTIQYFRVVYTKTDDVISAVRHHKSIESTGLSSAGGAYGRVVWS